MKKVRGRVDGMYAIAKVHSVTEQEIVFSTAFAKYRIPHSFITFKNANQKQIQNVIGNRVHSHEPGSKGGFIQDFYWFDLGDILDETSIERFKIVEGAE
jgi:hypothetical protein